MSEKSQADLTEEPRSWWVAVVLLAVPVVGLTLGWINTPRPQGLVEARQELDRSKLGDVVTTVAPTPSNPVEGVVMGGKIRVLGASIPTAVVKRGSRLKVDFHFQAEKEMEENWQIFVHTDLKGGRYRIHGDHFPAGGRYQTSFWRKGEYIKDAWSTLTPLDAPPGEYEVWLGFYIGDDRLKYSAGPKELHDGDNRVRLGKLRVE